MANPRNIGSGKRHIKFHVKWNDPHEGTVKQIVQAVRNFDQTVRNESMNWAADEIVTYAKRFIREGKEDSNVPDDNPRSYGLEDSFRIEWDHGLERDRMVVQAGVNLAGQEIPYAWMHNQPLGSTTTIVPVQAKALMFFWYRQEAFVWAKHVERPGIGFFDRAVDAALGASTSGGGRSKWDRRVKEEVKYLASRGFLDIHPTTGAHLRGNWRGYSAKARRDSAL